MVGAVVGAAAVGAAAIGSSGRSRCIISKAQSSSRIDKLYISSRIIAHLDSGVSNKGANTRARDVGVVFG